MEQNDLMPLLETALADLAGLLELSRVLDDDAAAGSDWPLQADRRALQREVAEATDGYLSTLIATAGGALTPQRIGQCRSETQARLASAWSERSRLAQLVERRRQPLGPLQNDLGQLVLLSLELRAAVRSLGEGGSFDTKSADPAENKVLVHLREATLAYLNGARSAGQASPGVGVPRHSALPELEKAAQHVAALTRLESEGAERAGPGAPEGGLNRDVAGPLRKLVQGWREPLDDGVPDEPLEADEAAAARQAIPQR